MEKRIKRRMEKIQHRSGENMEPNPRTPKNIHNTQKMRVSQVMFNMTDNKKMIACVPAICTVYYYVHA